MTKTNLAGQQFKKEKISLRPHTKKFALSPNSERERFCNVKFAGRGFGAQNGKFVNLKNSRREPRAPAAFRAEKMAENQNAQSLREASNALRGTGNK